MVSNYLFRIFKLYAGIAFFLCIMIIIGCGGDSSPNQLATGGTEAGNSSNLIIAGFVQKGPFIVGSQITIQELDEDLIPTGNTYTTETNDDFGSFSISVDLSSSFVEIIAQGFYYNEVEGNLSSAPITLSTISHVTEGFDIYVNILTSLASNRIRYLVQNENKSFEEALSQAQSEILAIFNIAETEIWDFDQMDISEEGNSNAILLAVSAILQGSNTVAELSELISKISLDIEEDGTLDNSTYRDEIENNSMTLDLVKIRTNLENRYASLGLTVNIPNFEAYIYSNLFTSQVNFKAGNGVDKVAIGDLDGDGDLDLVVTNSGQGFSMLLNNGDGTFATAVFYAEGNTGTGKMAIGDLDGDGDLDLTIIGNEAPVFINNGDGTFVKVGNYDIGFMPTSLSLGDLDGDGDLDMASSTADNVSVLLNNGNGTFATAVLYGAGYNTESSVMGDLDDDSDLDIAVTNMELDTISVLLNNGDGTFATAAAYPANDTSGVASMAIGDLDGDGDLDLVVTNLYSDTVSVLFNNGNGTFAQPMTFNAGDELRSVGVGDLDGDGDLDLVVTNHTVESVSMLFNKGDGTFTTAMPYNKGDYTPDLVMGDLDGDGDLDLVATDSQSDSVTVLWNGLNN